VEIIIYCPDQKNQVQQGNLPSKEQQGNLPSKEQQGNLPIHRFLGPKDGAPSLDPGKYDFPWHSEINDFRCKMTVF
jgi:hypothetical protein